MRQKALILVVISFLLLSAATFCPAEPVVDESKLFDLSLEELSNLKVYSAGKKVEKVADIPASVVIVTREEIETYGYTNLNEILSSIPGLYPVNDYLYDSNFGVRGFWSDLPNRNIIIMVNGVRTTSNYDGTHEIAKISIPVEAIDRIEVVRGPMSVISGSGAFFGIVNIKTNELFQGEQLNTVSGLAGTDNSLKLYGRSSGIQGDFKYNINASVFNSEGIDQPFVDMNDTLSGYTGDLLGKNEKYFDMSGFFRNFSVDFQYSESRNKIMFLFPSLDDGMDALMHTTNITFGYDKIINDKTRLNARLNYFYEMIEYNYDWNIIADKDFYGHQDVFANGFDIELLCFCKPVPELDLTTGINYRSILNVGTEMDLPGALDENLEHRYYSIDDDDNITTRAIFSQLEFRPHDKFKVVCGIRLEQMPEYTITYEHANLDSEDYTFTEIRKNYSGDKIYAVPRLAAILSIYQKNVLKFLYGMAINRPAYWQNRDHTLETNLPSLEPEFIQTMEVNYISTISDKLTTNFSVFHNYLNNLITRNVGFDDQDYYYNYFSNGGEVETFGGEISFNVKPIDKLRFDLSGTYQKATDLNSEDIEVGYCPQFLAYFKASYLLKDNIVAALSANFVNEMETLWDESPSNTSVPGSSPIGRIGRKSDGYVILNANLRWKNLFGKDYFANLHIANLLDTEIFYPTTVNSVWAPNGTLADGRQIFFSVGRRF